MSTLYVDNLRSNLSTKITVPSGNTLDVSAGTLIPSAGAVVQMVHAEFDGAATSTTATSFTDTGITINITPKYSTSKILVMVSQAISITRATNSRIDFRCLESGSSTTVFRYDYVGSQGGTGSTISPVFSASGVFQCSDTSQLTFKTQAVSANGSTAEAGLLYLSWYTEAKNQIQALEIAQ